MKTTYEVLNKTTFGKVTFAVVRKMADGSSFRDGGETPCTSIYYSETFGM